MYFILFIFSFYSFIFREKGRRGDEEGNIVVREKHQSIVCLSHMPRPGSKPASQACARPGIELETFCFVDDAQPTEPRWSGLLVHFLAEDTEVERG